MKLFITVDLEGFSSVSAWHEVSGNTPAFAQHQKTITKVLTRLCELLYKRFPNLSMITVCDSHAKGDSIIYEQLPAGVELVKGFPRRHYMMEGLNDTYAGVLFLGYHSGVGGFGNMDHTYSASVIYEIKINGEPVDEFLINAYLAGEYNVPVLCSIGGDKHIDDINRYNKKITTVVTKTELGKFSSIAPSYDDVDARLVHAIASMNEPVEYPVLRIEKPIIAEIMLINTIFAEVASLIPTVERIGGRTIRITSASVKEFYTTLMAVLFTSFSVK